MSTRILYAAILVFACAVQASSADESILQRVSQAEQAFESALADCRNEVLESLRIKRDAAQNRGDLAGLEKLNAEVSAFETADTIPQAAYAATAQRRVSSAQAKLATEYRLAIKTYTKQGEIAQAKVMQGALDRLLSGQNQLPKGSVRFRDHAYKIFSDTLTWEQANKKCVTLGGQLASATDAEENSFLLKLASEAKLPAVWLGLTDRAAEGVWHQTDGSKAPFANWEKKQSQPNNAKGVEHYAVLLVGSSGQWWDFPNDPLQYPDLTFSIRPGFVCRWTLGSESE